MNGMVVVPTYNERENLPRIVPQILAHDLDILVVDDNSPDGTGALADELAAGDSRVHVLHRPGKQGLGRAYIAGFRRALELGAPFIFEMDADFSHDPKYLPALLGAARSSYDLAIGSRYVAGGGTTDWGAGRRFISKGGNFYARLILGLPLADATAGYRCYRRAVLDTLNLDAITSNGYSFQIEMAYRTHSAGFKVGEIPIIFPDRRVGQSKMSRQIVIEALINVWKMRFTKLPPKK
ncbi:MAG TPA: polyprenol monophosphomannose synthase [Herpetosiphonaceae bacterium]